MNKITETLLLDEEEQWLREEGATTLKEVARYYDRHYPYARGQARMTLIAELYQRLQVRKPTAESKCRLPLD